MTWQAFSLEPVERARRWSLQKWTGKAGVCGVVVVDCTQVSHEGGRWPSGAYLVGVLNQRSTLTPRFDEEWAWAAVVELMIIVPTY
jgi:hypothetical protein